MNFTAVDLLRSVEALIGFSIFFIPFGYLFAFVTQIANFRSRSLPERLLWAVSLSIPLAILQSVMLGKHLSPGTSNAIVYLCGITCAIVLLIQGLRGHLFRKAEWDRPTRVTALAMAGLALYVPLATVGIQFGHKLFEPVVSTDWSVRVPLVNATIHGAVPPDNPFYGINGQSFQLRYYYYWYVLCGQMGRMLHTTPRAVLTASSVWSGLALFSVLFLSFKYLFRPEGREADTSLRRLCMLSLPVSCILGLDILPILVGAVTHPTRVFPDLEWWRAISVGDFAASFQSAILYSPHHTAGFVSCMTGFILLTLRVADSENPSGTWTQQLFNGVVAGVCFAAAVGCSTYMTLFFVIACVLFAIDRAFARAWSSIAAVALSGIVAVSLSWSFLHEILTNAGASIAPGHGNRFLSFYPRDWKLAFIALHLHWGNTKGIPIQPHWIDLLLRIPFWLGLLITELGFFGFVLAYRIATDWKQRKLLSNSRRFQWILCGSIAFCGLFLTSAPVIGINDLGRHAGIALRFVAILWATPLVARWLWSDKPWPLLQRAWLRRAILATIILGFTAQIWQVVLQRTYLMIVNTGRLVTRPPFPLTKNIGSRYFDAREAFTALDRTFPPTALVQFNPRSSNWTLMSIYLNQRVVAIDSYCGATFGGDEAACAKAMPQLQALFGGSHFLDNRIAFDPHRVTTQAFEQICSQHHLVALIASSSDRVWPERTSWVWTQPVIFANSSFRIIACPK